MNKQPIISLCIPTNGIVHWVMPVINSIYEQGVDLDLFEVVVADNGNGDKLKEAVKAICYPNFHYYKTNEVGFVNQIENFRLSTGVFCKMLNHRALLVPGALHEMISIVRKYIDTKPSLYFIDGELADDVFIECNNVDEFVKKMHFYTSWSKGVGIWDIDKQYLDQVSPNKMFPHMCLLFDLRKDPKFVIWNKRFMQMQDESGKGGYDLFYTFAVVLNDIMYNAELQKKITHNTFQYFKSKLYFLLRSSYYTQVVKAKSTKFCFLIKDIKKSMTIYYSCWHYYWMIIWSYLYYLKVDILHLK